MSVHSRSPARKSSHSKQLLGEQVVNVSKIALRLALKPLMPSLQAAGVLIHPKADLVLEPRQPIDLTFHYRFLFAATG